MRKTATSSRMLGAFTGLLLLVAGAHAQDYHWHCTLTEPTYAVAFNPLSNGRTVFTSTPYSQSILRSDDGGEHWYGSLPLDEATPVVHQLYCLPSDTSIVFALSTSDFHQTPTLYRSTDGGNSWTASPGIGGIDGEALSYDPTSDVLYYGENFAGDVYRSADHGKTWTHVGMTNNSVTLCSLSVSADSEHVLLAGSVLGVIARSTNEGTSWDVVYPADSVQSPEVPKIVISETTPAVAFATRWHSLAASLVMTSNHGKSWEAVASPDPHVWALELDQRRVSNAGAQPMHLWTGLFTQRVGDTTAGGLIEESTDAGNSWRSTGFPHVVSPPNVWVLKYDTTSGLLAAATDSGFFIGKEPRASVSNRSASTSPLAFFPNPTNGVTTVVLPSAERSGSLRIVDVTGRQCFVGSIVTDRTRIELSTLPPGVYVAQWLTRRGETARAKLVKLP